MQNAWLTELAQPVQLVSNEPRNSLILVKIGPIENPATSYAINNQLETMGIKSKAVWAVGVS